MDLEILITGLMILFILSTITEKLANFIKLNDTINDTKNFKNIKIRTVNEEDEKNREKKIQIISILIGVAVALICKANIFEILTSENVQLFWSAPYTDLLSSFTIIVGCIICGIFLSFGSKFFHDLLDIVFQIKELKNKLNVKKLAEIKTINEFDEYIKNNEYDRVKARIDEEKRKLKAIEGVAGIDWGSDETGYYCKVYHNKIINNIPSRLFYPGYNGKIKSIEVKMIPSEEIKTMARIKPSYEISNRIPFNDNLKGSIGCFVKYFNSDDRLLLTCYHVVRTNNQNWYNFNPNSNDDVVHPYNGEIIGKIVEARVNYLHDFAIIKLNDITLIENNISEIGTVLEPRDLTETDKGKKVRMRGNYSGLREGKIESINFDDARVRYPDGNYFSFDNLIQIKSLDSLPFSEPGDSGSLLVGEDGYSLGIVFAGTSEYSLAFPVKNLFNMYNLIIY